MPGARVGLGTAAYEADMLPADLPRPVMAKEKCEFIAIKHSLNIFFGKHYTLFGT